MDDILDFLGFFVKLVLVSISTLLVLVVGIYSIFVLDFEAGKILNKSNVEVILDGNKIYRGKGYAVEYSNQTENLQAPMFKVTIHGKHVWDVNKQAFGKELKVINIGG